MYTCVELQGGGRWKKKEIKKRKSIFEKGYKM